MRCISINCLVHLSGRGVPRKGQSEVGWEGSLQIPHTTLAESKDLGSKSRQFLSLKVPAILMRIDKLREGRTKEWGQKRGDVVLILL